jgi:hypothetical protein
MEQTSELVTVTHAAQQLRMSPQNVRRLADVGRLPCQRTSSGERLFSISAIEDERRRRDAAAGRER